VAVRKNRRIVISVDIDIADVRVLHLSARIEGGGGVRSFVFARTLRTKRVDCLFSNAVCTLFCSAYHGHLTSLIDISPYKLNLPGAPKKPDHVHVVRLCAVVLKVGLHDTTEFRRVICTLSSAELKRNEKKIVCF